MINPKTRQHKNAWDSADDDPLWLLTVEELDEIPYGAVLHDIAGKTYINGTDYIDRDTRFGVTAYGIRESEILLKGWFQ